MLVTPLRMPAAEIDLDEDVVRRLLKGQHPDLAGLPLTLADHGWDNAIYRLGEDLAVRLPRRTLAVGLIANEQRWLPELATRLPLPIPAPVRIGHADAGYPWPWSITRWFAGRPAAEVLPGDPDHTVITLANFLTALHVAAPAEAPPNPFRGGPLPGHDATLRERVGLLARTVNAEAIIALWDRLSVTPPWPSTPVWLHGDLHLANIIVHHDRLAAVIDFGDLTAGDPATDLSVAWQLFDTPQRRRLFDLLGTDPDTRIRARGWALHLSLAYLTHSVDNPRIARLGRRTLQAVLAGE